MAIDGYYVKLLRGAYSFFQNRKLENNIKVAALSYLDILVPEEKLKQSFPHLNSTNLEKRNDSDWIRKWHGISEIYPIVETSSLFKNLGFDADFFDFEKNRGFEKIIDLNYPIASDYISKYDLVLDTGTLEHCFNVGTAFVNMCQLVANNGMIITASPVTKINHGFWNFSPCAYFDFFSQNNWKILHYQALARQKEGLVPVSADPDSRKPLPPEVVHFMVVKKMHNSTTAFPVQKKYLKK